MTPMAQWNLYRILPFGIIWLVAGWIFQLVEVAAMDGLENTPQTAIYVTPKVFVFASFASFLIGLIIGTTELFYLNSLFSDKSFLKKLIYKFTIYGALFFIIITLLFPIAALMELDTSITDDRVWGKYGSFLGSATFLSTALQMSVSLGLCLFYAEIADHLGQGVLKNFFTGKYHAPREESRIFMFVDMKSSTTVAEKLGHVDYFKFLRRYYADLSHAVIHNGGEIYQYVGDEMVLTWTNRKERTAIDCLKCFFDMRRALAKRADTYDKKFGVRPVFKAGVHLGAVTTGEVGIVKKEILFTGDVLNTAARIQALCNDFGVDLLLSEDFVKATGNTSDFRFVSKGEVGLRGKKERLQLYGVEYGKVIPVGL